jgi:hypothetical protein
MEKDSSVPETRDFLLCDSLFFRKDLSAGFPLRYDSDPA